LSVWVKASLDDLVPIRIDVGVDGDTAVDRECVEMMKFPELERRRMTAMVEMVGARMMRMMRLRIGILGDCTVLLSL